MNKIFLNNVNSKLTLDIDKFQQELKKIENSHDEICIFGFTFILYHHVIKNLIKKGIKKGMINL